MNIKLDLSNAIDVDELLCEFSGYILNRYRSGHMKAKIWERILSHMATTLIYIGFLLLIAGITLVEFGAVIVEVIRSLVQILCSRCNKQTIQSQRIELAFRIREILCEILQKNANVLGVLEPNIVSDITPTQYSVYASINGFDYLQFIVSHCNDISDLEKKRDLLNQKIIQYAQENLYALPVFYNDLCIYTVFEIATDLYHQDCLCIKIMIIDSLDKYNFVVQHLVPKQTVSLKQVDDMEF